MAALFSRLQDALGDRLGKDVYLISISVDPEIDTPERLKAYAARFRGRPGWVFVTGEKRNVDAALAKLGQKVDDKQDHMSQFLVGNLRTGLWKKIPFATYSFEDIKRIVESVVADAGAL